MKKSLVFWLILLIFVGLVTACGGQEADTPKSVQSRPEPPPEYSGYTNPVEGNPEAISAGKEIFRINCVMCHGESGAGDGPTAASLNPKPASLANAQEKLSDAYLFWRISEGGLLPPFSSAMPPWKTVLGSEKIWEVIAFLRTLKTP